MNPESTVRLNLSCSLEGMPFDFDTTVDTGLTRQQWDALYDEQRNEIGDKILAEWTATVVTGDWNVAE